VGRTRGVFVVTRRVVGCDAVVPSRGALTPPRLATLRAHDLARNEEVDPALNDGAHHERRRHRDQREVHLPPSQELQLPVLGTVANDDANGWCGVATHQLVDVTAEPHRDHDGAAPSHTHNTGAVR